MSYGKGIVDAARSGLLVFLIDLLRGNDELSREVRDYLADVVAGKEKIKHAKLPSLSPYDVFLIRNVWRYYTDPENIKQALAKKRKNLLGAKRAVPDLVSYFQHQNRKVSSGTIKDVIAARKTYAGLFKIESIDGKFVMKILKFVNREKVEKV